MAMTTRFSGALSALVLLFACVAGSDPARPAPAPATPETSSPKEPRMQEQIEIIEEEPLRGFLAQGACVAVGKVQKVELFNQGTRGARLRIHVEVEKQLHGSLPRQFSFMTFGGPGDAKAGDKLLLAVKPPAPQAQDAVLQSFYVVPEGRVEEALRAQQEALSKALQKPGGGG
jgi:hypothetical protein